MTSVIQNELEVEELAKDESEVMKVDATVEEVVNSVLEAVVTLAKEPMEEDAIKEESCLAIGPHSSATKDEKWLNAMRMTLDELEAEYAPHPFPYEGADGFLHSADVHPPQVDFSALGFNSRRLPTPVLHPVHGCSRDEKFYTCGSPHCEVNAKWPGWRLHWDHIGADFAQPSPFGSLPGLLTSGGVIQMPSQLFGFNHISGSGRDTIWAMSAC